MDTADFLRHIQTLLWYEGQLAHLELVPSRRARFSEPDPPLDDRLRAALAGVGADSLYAHQAAALSLARRGRDFIVATPAASGKSMCYNLPVLEMLLADRSARALYLYPTKALAQDQMKKLRALIPEGARLKSAVFDGDTRLSDRAAIRRAAHVVLTNPDMLHLGILPNHRAWHRTLRGLRYIILDEAHVYRGVFGAHVANVLRRLRRLCRKAGGDPRFILCSATIANPAEHAERLVGLPFEVVDDDGSPYGGKDFAFWNPPITDPEKGARRSTNSEATQVFVELLKRETRTMAFVRGRRQAELIYVYARDQLRHTHKKAAASIAPYRAGYLPEDRRRIEKELFEGRLLGLSTTSAMELGVDVGNLDATIITGYPGTIASAWQQAGRSGRGGERSLSVLIAQDDPLDQYLMRHPEAFFGKSPETARISPGNPHIMKPHLLCAAYESPLSMADTEFFGHELLWYADELAEDEYIHVRADRWHLTPEVDYPAQMVALRSSGGVFTLVDRETGAVLENVSEHAAYRQLHPGAVYLHQGESYLVGELDLTSATAYAEPTDAPYYTQARDYTDTRVLRVIRQRQAGRTTAFFGEVSVANEVVGFKRIKHHTDEVLGDEYLDMPTQEYDTAALWFGPTEDAIERIRKDDLDLMGGLHAAEHAAIGILPLFAMCDRNDIGGVSTPMHPDTGNPQIFIHDGYPGGVGVSEHGYEIIEDLWRATLDVISNCACESGCPSCIHSPKCGNNNHPLDKTAARIILEKLLDEG